MPILPNHEGIRFTKGLPGRACAPEAFDEHTGRYAFARGFLLCRQADVEMTPYFAKERLTKEYYLYRHYLLREQNAAREDIRIVLLGTACFAVSFYAGRQETPAQTLLSILAGEGRGAFLDALDALGGRYVVLLIRGEHIEIFQDACGLRCVYYAPGAHAAGSHLDLVNKVAQSGLSAIEKDIRTQEYVEFSYAYVGKATKYEGIYFQTPNFVLSCDDFSEKRFYPRREKRPDTMDISRVRDEYFASCQLQVKELERLYGKKLCCSLTGGRDSRVTYYAIRETVPDIYFFTEARDHDIEAAQRIAKRDALDWLGYDSKDVHAETSGAYGAFQREIRNRVFPISASWALQGAFFNHVLFGEDDYIHIHSNCAEAARGRGAAIEYDFPSGTYRFEAFQRAYIASTCAWRQPEIAERQEQLMKNDGIIREELHRYFTFLHHEDVRELGYNPWDFMYIEQRVACFLSQIHMLNDFTFDSLSLTNCRAVLEILWQIPERYINRSCLLYDCILNAYDEEARRSYLGSHFDAAVTRPHEDTDEVLLYGGYHIYQQAGSVEERRAILQRVIGLNPSIEWPYRKLLQEAAARRDAGRCGEIVRQAGRYRLWPFCLLARARIDIKNWGDEDNDCDIEADDTGIRHFTPAWFAGKGTGHQLESDAGHLKLKIRCHRQGLLRIECRASDYREHLSPGGGRLPLYIDYTKLKLGGDAVLEEMHSAWHDDPIVLRRPCGDGEEFQLEVRWRAHRYPDEEYLHIMDEFVRD